jgi:hypothetical protein
MSALGTVALTSLVGAIVGGTVLGPFFVWASTKLHDLPRRVVNAFVVRGGMAVWTIYATVWSAWELLAVHDFIVGLAVIPVGFLVGFLLLWFATTKLPDWLTVSILFVSVTLFAPLLGFTVLLIFTKVVPATSVIWDLPPVVYVIIGSVLGLVVAFYAVLDDLEAHPS